MLCQICKRNNSTFELLEIVENKRKVLYICSGCKDKYQTFEFDTYFNNSNKEAYGMAKVVKCPVCLQTINDLIKKRELGCEYCYKHFSDIIDQISKNIEHKGKVPLTKEVQLNKKDSISDIENKLKSAIAREDFKKAQELKDLRDSFLND